MSLEEKVSVPWGMFDMAVDGYLHWKPNELLIMSAQEQYDQNKRNGVFDNQFVVWADMPSEDIKLTPEDRNKRVDGDATIKKDMLPLSDARLYEGAFYAEVAAAGDQLVCQAISDRFVSERETLGSDPKKLAGELVTAMLPLKDAARKEIITILLDEYCHDCGSDNGWRCTCIL